MRDMSCTVTRRTEHIPPRALRPHTKRAVKRRTLHTSRLHSERAPPDFITPAHGSTGGRHTSARVASAGRLRIAASACDHHEKQTQTHRRIQSVAKLWPSGVEAGVEASAPRSFTSWHPGDPLAGDAAKAGCLHPWPWLTRRGLAKPFTPPTPSRRRGPPAPPRHNASRPSRQLSLACALAWRDAAISAIRRDTRHARIPNDAIAPTIPAQKKPPPDRLRSGGGCDGKVDDSLTKRSGRRPCWLRPCGGFGHGCSKPGLHRGRRP